MTVSAGLFKIACPTNNEPSSWASVLSKVLVDIPPAMFLAQTGHESADYKFLRENLNYSRDALLRVFPKYFDNALATQYARQPERIANVVYAGRMGNIQPGDGWKFRGGGLIQLTGRNNYTAWGKSIGITPDEAAAYITTKEGAIRSALWFWTTNKINNSDILSATKAINGGVNGLTDRAARYNRIVAAINRGI